MGKKSHKQIRNGFLKEYFFVFIIIILLIGIITISLNLAQKDKAVPRMEIVLNDVTLEEINNNSKDIKYPGNEVYLNDNGVEISWKDVEIKGRGNYTWGDVKKPYRLEFRSGVDMLGLPKTRKKILLTNNLDDSLVRNDIGLYIATLIGEKYVYTGEFVWLKMDRQDLGVYYVVNPVGIGKRAVDLKDPYGVLMEMDNYNCKSEEEWYEAESGDCLVVKDAVDSNNLELGTKSFMKNFDLLERAAADGDYDVVEEVADMRSFAEYYLVSELSANPDAYVTSFYFYKDGEDDVIHAGPVWDFDGAFGNTNLGLEMMGEDFFSPWNDGSRKEYAFGWEYYDDETGEYVKVEAEGKISKLIYHLLEMPQFQETVKDVYSDMLKDKLGNILGRIDERTNYIRKDALIDTKMWNKNSFVEAIDYLKWWLRQRFFYLEMKFDGIDKKGNIQKL